MSDKPVKSLLSEFRADPAEHGKDAGSAPAMLRLKLLKPGGEPNPRERWAFPYPYLKRVELENPSRLLLFFSEATVTVQGPKMDELFEQVAQHKTAVIEVVSQATRQAGGDVPITSVDSIDVKVQAG